ncbi:MAG: AEC family transporter [Deinococcota bacterium]
MLTIIFAIIPVVVVTSLGYAFKHYKFLDDAFWVGADKLAYYVLLPSLFVRLTATAALEHNLLTAPLTLVIAMLLITGLMLVTRRAISSTPPAFTSVYQGAVRFNSFVLVALSLELYGDAAATTIAICIAVIVPLVNLTSVAILSRYGESTQTPSLTRIVKRLVTNPLIVACVLGLCLNALTSVLNMSLPTPFLNSLDILGRAALPVGLLCVGAGINLKLLGSWQIDVVVSNVIKLLIKPLLVMGLGLLMGLEGIIFAATVLFAAMPTATSAYILARQLGGEATLMANIIMTQTVLSALTIPVVLTLFEILML